MWVGEESIFILSTLNDLYAAGMNTHGQLCFNPLFNDNGNSQKSLVKLSIKPDYVSAGHYHTLFKVNEKVYGCGLNSQQQMSSIEGDLLEPTLIFQKEDLKSVAACSDGSIFFSESGVEVIGSQIMGELGLGQLIQVKSLTKIEIDQDLDQVVCRTDFSFIYSVQNGVPQNNINVGLIIGLCVGGAIILVIIAFLSYIIIKLCKDKKNYIHIGRIEDEPNDEW